MMRSASPPTRISSCRTSAFLRRSLTAVASQADAFKRTYGSVTDDWCQDNGKCRKLARNFPTHVNLTSFATEFARGLLSVKQRLRACT